MKTLGQARNGTRAGGIGAATNMVRMTERERWKLYRKMKDKTITALKKKRWAKEKSDASFDPTPRLVKRKVSS